MPIHLPRRPEEEVTYFDLAIWVSFILFVLWLNY